MTVTPYNPGQYLVTSRTEEGVEYLVDLLTLECACPGALEFGATSPLAPCAHIEAALHFAAGRTNHKPRSGSPFALLICQQT